MPARVLVVEDDIAIRQLLVAILTRDGYAVDLAVDGDEAIAAIGNQAYDAVLLDLMMPKTNGYDVVEHIVREDLNIPIVVATAAIKQIDLSRLDRRVVTQVIKKPFDVDEVREAVLGAVQR